MMKERRYNSTHIEVCRNCQGAGTVMPELPPAAPVERECVPRECEVCGGSGRVHKTTDVIIRIEPYPGVQ